MKLKKITAFILLLSVFLSLCSCSKGTVPKITDGGFDPSVTSAHDKDAYTEFALKLVKSAASERGKNAAVSAYSVISALAVLSNGAKGESLAQIEKATGCSAAALNAEALYLHNAAENEDGAEIKVSNSVFMKDGFDILENAYTAGASVYSATPGKNTVKFINNLCSENTNGEVKTVIDSFNDTELTVLSTLLFDCSWNEIYEDKDVKTLKFKNYDGTVTETQILCTK